MNSVMHNHKTLRSLDLTTICPKVRAGNPCEYCYVNQARTSNTRTKKQLIDRIPYNHEILRLRKETIIKLNKMGGLRLFSFADYIPWMDEDLEKLISDAEKRHLLLKAITKQRQFVEKYKDRMLINFSVDLILPDYPPEDVLIRCMVRNYEEVLQAYNWADILTPYHGKRISKDYRPKEALNACLDLAPEKTCCATGSCSTCSVRCGMPLDKILDHNSRIRNN